MARVASYVTGGTINTLLALFQDKQFFFNTPAMRNAGRPKAQLAACFKVPVDDKLFSINTWRDPESVGIFNAAGVMGHIFQSGGGVGVDFTPLRPQGTPVASGGVASGPVSFMEIFNVVTEVTRQAGARRGAMMALLHCDHPDILAFIQAKDDNGKLNGMNLSVQFTDAFMDSLRADDPDDPWGADNKAVWRAFVAQAWKNGEPGAFFIDTVNKANTTPEYGPLTGCNPCGEQPLYDWETCVLGSINLGKFFTTDATLFPWQGHSGVDWAALQTTIDIAVQGLNALIDLNHYPLPIIEKMTKRTRKIGLGIMGWADFLVQMGVSYDSGDALDLAELIMGRITAHARLCVARSAFANATVTTIAPTGSISILAECSAGIEPYYALVYDRWYDGRYYEVVEPAFEHWLYHRVGIEGVIWDNITDTLPRIKANNGSIQGLDSHFTEEEQALWQVAHEISPQGHLAMQQAFQRHTDNAVSKTINLPVSATVGDVEKLFHAAWGGGSKGLTVYRDASREQQVLKTAATSCPTGRDTCD